MGARRDQLAQLREQRAVQLRLLRYPYDAIASSMLACPDHRPDGDRACVASDKQVRCVVLYPSGRSAARKAVVRAIAREYPDDGEGRRELKAEQRGQIDLLLQRSLRAAMGGDWEAARVAVRLLDRRAALEGLDAPKRVQITTEIDQRIEELLEQMGELQTAPDFTPKPQTQ